MINAAKFGVLIQPNCYYNTKKITDKRQSVTIALDRVPNS